MSPARHPRRQRRHQPKAAPKWNDTRLVKECLSGNESAWAQLIDKYKELIYSIPIKYNLPSRKAADVFQSTCVELLVRLPELREPARFPKWLMQSRSSRSVTA